MFFFLSKTAYFIMMPLGWILVALLCSWWFKIPHWKRRLRRAAVIMTLIFTNPLLSNVVMYYWEYRPVPFGSVPVSQTAIVLTGVAKNRMELRDRVYFNKGADRVLHAYELYRRGIVKKILISGGSGALIPGEYTEANTLKNAFMMLGVPENDLITEERSRNTWESASILKNEYNKHLKEGNILVTSSFHMKRAKGCFDKAGIQVFSFPADFHSDTLEITPESFIPSPHALVKWHIVIHEIVGIVAYKIMGYN